MRRLKKLSEKVFLDDMQQDTLGLILGNTFTVADAHQRVALLKEFLEYVFYAGDAAVPTTERLEAFIREREYAPEHGAAVSAWGSALFNTITAGTLYQRINTLLKDLEAVPVLTLYTAVKFSPPDMQSLGTRVRDLIGTMLLLDDRVEPTLYAGCAFVWNGIYHDYSLHYFMHKKESELLTLISRYGGN